MALYGYTSPGEGSQEMGINGIPIELAGGEALLSGFVHCASGVGGASVKMMLYLASNGSLVAESNTGSTPTGSADWVECTFAGAETPAAGSYILAVMGSSWQIDITRDIDENNIHYEGNGVGGYPAAPNPPTWNTTTSGREWSMYLATGSSSTPTITTASGRMSGGMQSLTGGMNG